MIAFLFRVDVVKLLSLSSAIRYSIDWKVEFLLALISMSHARSICCVADALVPLRLEELEDDC